MSKEVICLHRINRTVVVCDENRREPKPQIISFLEEKLTYYERKFNFQSQYNQEGASRIQTEMKTLYARHPRTNLLTFPLGLRPRIASELNKIGLEVRYFSKPLLTPEAESLDWDGLFADFQIFSGQDECLSKIIAADGGVVAATTGAGKSVIIRMLCRLYNKAKIHIITKSATLADEIVTDVAKVIPNVGFVGAGKKKFSRVTVFIADSMHHGMGEADIVLADECFTGDVEVLVPGGSRRIDSVRPGDLVYCATGLGKVDSVFCRPKSNLYRVEFSDGTQFVCTGDHPVFTEKGWIPSRQLDGSTAFGPEAVRFLWEADRTVAEQIKDGKATTPIGTELDQAKDLLAILCEEACEPDEQATDPSQGPRAITRDQAQADQERRERAIATLTSTCAATRTRGRVGVRSVDSNEETSGEWLPDGVQIGHCSQGQEDRDRIGRRQSLLSGTEDARREKDDLDGRARVVRVSRVECEGPVPVFNLRVSGHPSYFANGKLVHNCHQLAAPTYSQMLGRYTSAKMIGFSATPKGRMDGRDVLLEAIFGPILYEFPYQEAQSAGRVVPITTEFLRVKEGPDVSGIGSIPVREQVGIWTNQHRNKVIAERVKQFEPDEQVMIMVKTIEHAVRLKELLPDFTLIHAADGMDPERFREYVRSGMLQADEPQLTKDRLKTLRRDFASGKLKKVISNYVWSTGVNFVNLAVLVRADAAASEIADGQIPGRICRRVPGIKESALLIDVYDEWDQTFLERSRKRRVNYAKRGWEITFSDPSLASKGG